MFNRKVGVIDYGAGNLFSVGRGLNAAGLKAFFVTDSEKLNQYDALVLPGVGAFGDGMDKLRSIGMDQAIIEFAQTGKQILGICLGMQFLMSCSYEFGKHKGLDLIPGNVNVIPKRQGWRVPNIGWCPINFMRDPEETPFVNAASGTDFYFIHSYYCIPDESNDILATIEFSELHLTAIISQGNVHGCQFHPEISGQHGIEIYNAFYNKD
tara:strand:+ start:550 stop:1179 length:630 start_codon:yes stop_codon:yes gene_type:complete